MDEVQWDDLGAIGGFGRCSRPVLVTGAVKAWPAREPWSFERLAELRKPDGSAAVARFNTGVVEQGATREQLDALVGPYLCELARTAGDTPAARRPDACWSAWRGHTTATTCPRASAAA